MECECVLGMFRERSRNRIWNQLQRIFEFEFCSRNVLGTDLNLDIGLYLFHVDFVGVLFVQFRFRCSRGGCKTVFCSGCGATPYHVGYTCSEYKSYLESKKCRFCEVSLNASNTAPVDMSLKEGLSAVCTAAECLEKRRWSCDLVHKCGHNCIGLMGHDCIDCMHPDCAPKNADINDEDFCNICWVDPLRAAPCVELQCGHYFHFMCLWQKIDRKWPAARITFGFLNCPLCKQEIHHPALDDITNKYYELKKEIERDAVERVKIEGLQVGAHFVFLFILFICCFVHFSILLFFRTIRGWRTRTVRTLITWKSSRWTAWHFISAVNATSRISEGWRRVKRPGWNRRRIISRSIWCAVRVPAARMRSRVRSTAKST